MKKNRVLAKKYLTPINVVIGSNVDRKNAQEIKEEIRKLKSDPNHPKINQLIIYANGVDTEAGKNIGLEELNPKKIILSKVYAFKVLPEYWALSNSKKWQIYDSIHNRQTKFTVNQATAETCNPFFLAV